LVRLAGPIDVRRGVASTTYVPSEAALSPEFSTPTWQVKFTDRQEPEMAIMALRGIVDALLSVARE